MQVSAASFFRISDGLTRPRDNGRLDRTLAQAQLHCTRYGEADSGTIVSRGQLIELAAKALAWYYDQVTAKQGRPTI